MKKIISLALCMAGLSAFAASPTFNSFNTNQFTTIESNNAVALKSGVTLTNAALTGTTSGLPLATSTNVGVSQPDGLTIKASNGVLSATGSATNAIANTNGVGNGTTLNGTTTINGGIAGTAVVPVGNGGTGTATARSAGANIGVYQMSPPGGNSGYYDMFATPSAFNGQIGVSSYGAGSMFLWVAGGQGTNQWINRAIAVPQGFAEWGNYLWADNAIAPQSNDTTMYFMWGSNASRFSTAFPNGFPGPIVQPAGLRVRCGNPFSGTAQVALNVTETNNVGGTMVLVGTNADGVTIYEDQYGFSMYQNSFAYPVGEANLAGTQGALMNQPAYDYCISLNGQRPSDTNTYQYSVFTMVQTNQANIYGGFPYQVANVESAHNPLFRWALKVNESTGEVDATNGPTYASRIVVGAPYPGNYTNDNLSVNGSAGFQGTVDTFDTAGFFRLGFETTNSMYPGLTIAANSPMNFYRSSSNDLRTVSQTLTNVMNLDTNNILNILNAVSTGNGYILQTNSAFAGPTISNGVAMFWNSNATVYLRTSRAGATNWQDTKIASPP